MATYRRVYDSCLSVKNRDQLRNPTPGNRVWAMLLLKERRARRGKGGEESGKGMGREGKDDTETGPPVA